MFTINCWRNLEGVNIILECVDLGKFLAKGITKIGLERKRCYDLVGILSTKCAV